MLELVAAGEEMQDRSAGVDGFQKKTAVEAAHDVVAATILPRYQLMERPSGDFVERDEGRALNAQAQAQDIFGVDVRGYLSSKSKRRRQNHQKVTYTRRRRLLKSNN